VEKKVKGGVQTGLREKRNWGLLFKKGKNKGTNSWLWENDFSEPKKERGPPPHWNEKRIERTTSNEQTTAVGNPWGKGLPKNVKGVGNP